MDFDDFFSQLEFQEDSNGNNEKSVKGKNKYDDLFSQMENIEKEDENKKEENTEIKKVNDLYCSNCGCEDGIINDGEMRVCTQCGMEHGDVIDDSAEWRYYGNEDNKRGSDPNRCGMPNNQMLGISSLSTVVMGHGFEKYRKFSKWMGLTYKERELIRILNDLRRKANMDNLPEAVIDKTMYMWKMVSDDYIKRGISKESLVAACFVYALKDNGIVRSMEEISKLFGIKQKKLEKGRNEFMDLMYHKDKKYVQNNVTCISIHELCAQYAKMLDFPEEARKECIKIGILVNKMGICMSNIPKSISVGILYFVSEHYGLGVTKKQIKELCKVSETTITNTYNQIVKYSCYLIRN